MRGSNFCKFFDRVNHYDEPTAFQENYMKEIYMAKQQDLMEMYGYDYEHYEKQLDKCKEWRRKAIYNANIDRQISEASKDDIYGGYSCELQALEKTRHFLGKMPSEPSFLPSPSMMSVADLEEHYKIEAFNDCIMVNFSPNWKGGGGYEKKINFLKLFIRTYINDSRRFKRTKWVIERGGDGDFIHAHCVFEIEPSRKQQVIGQIRKGTNFKRTMVKIWNKLSTELGGTLIHNEGFGGLLEGKYAIQTTLIKNKALRDDKLDYLIEEKKPASHQNKGESHIENGWD